uniref:BZIP domain-containing protein n=1 Tax=Globodera rostochiensis TaxID=31243 RepID=A0A914GV34_GLORO
MSVPFVSDEFLLKRSLFSSIFGVANRLKQAKTTATTAATSSSASSSAAAAGQQHQFECFVHSADEPRQPCSSSRIPRTTEQDQQRELDNLCRYHGASDGGVYHASPSPTQTVACSPTTQLGKQFSDQLQFVEQQQQQHNDEHEQQQHQDNNNVDDDDDDGRTALTREQIYAEIVRECNEFEKLQNNDQHQQQNDEQQPMLEVTPKLPTATTATTIDGVHHPLGNLIRAPTENAALITSGGAGGVFSLDLERLIKVVVAHVLKEVKSGGNGMTMPRRQKRSESSTKCGGGDGHDASADTGVPCHGENAEQILERKREQNNAAAARYRQRQKEQKDLLLNELCQLEQQNAQLSAAIAVAQREIDVVKADLWRRTTENFLF